MPSLTLQAPLDGWCAPLSEVPDAVFADGMIGDSGDADLAGLAGGVDAFDDHDAAVALLSDRQHPARDERVQLRRRVIVSESSDATHTLERGRLEVVELADEADHLPRPAKTASLRDVPEKLQTILIHALIIYQYS